jgi:hypothetical protein
MYRDCNVAIGKFMKKFFGERKIEDALNRLDRLTLDEGRMAGTETLQVVNRVEGDMKLIVGGMQLFVPRF